MLNRRLDEHVEAIETGSAKQTRRCARIEYDDDTYVQLGEILDRAKKRVSSAGTCADCFEHAASRQLQERLVIFARVRALLSNASRAI